MSEKELTAYFRYLDSLRKAGSVNMFGAATYLMNEFCVDRHEARKILSLWMETFDADVSCKQRVEKVKGK